MNQLLPLTNKGRQLMLEKNKTANEQIMGHFNITKGVVLNKPDFHIYLGLMIVGVLARGGLILPLCHWYSTKQASVMIWNHNYNCIITIRKWIKQYYDAVVHAMLQCHFSHTSNINGPWLACRGDFGLPCEENIVCQTLSKCNVYTNHRHVHRQRSVPRLILKVSCHTENRVLCV